MTLRFDRNSLVAFARPAVPSATPRSASASSAPFAAAAALRLRDLMSPLYTLAPQHPRLPHDQAVERAHVDRLHRRLRDKPPPMSEATRLAAYEARMIDERERRLRYLELHRLDLKSVFEKYGERLPTAWQRWLWWAHRCYEHALPRDLPALLEAIEALIAVEAQLQVDGRHPNRDHVVHQLADAEVAAKLHAVATPGFDDRDWNLLSEAVPRAAALDRGKVTRCGLALAGMFHDIGYLRYVGAFARHALSASFGLVAPGPTFDLWEVIANLGGTYLDRILWRRDTSASDGLVADVFAFAWDNGWHGALSAMVLASTARRLRIEGRSTPQVEAALQIATAAAFFHELHAVKPAHDAVPRAVAEARERIQGYAWPVLFRIVDELQCWFRPELVPSGPDRPGAAHLAYGAHGAELVSLPGTSASRRQIVLHTPQASVRALDAKEASALRYLARQQPEVFRALGVENHDDIVVAATP
jgi:hypothetical protein